MLVFEIARATVAGHPGKLCGCQCGEFPGADLADVHQAIELRRRQRGDIAGREDVELSAFQRTKLRGIEPRKLRRRQDAELRRGEGRHLRGLELTKFRHRQGGKQPIGQGGKLRRGDATKLRVRQALKVRGRESVHLGRRQSREF